MMSKEILKQLVETEDKDERMSIVEANYSEEEPEAEVDNSQVEALETENASLKEQLQEQKQKYIDRFFEAGESKPDPEEEPEPEEPKTLAELGL